MAYVRFFPPLTKVVGIKSTYLDADTVRDLCLKLIKTFKIKKNLLLDEDDNLSRDIVVLVNRKNAHILQGADTSINSETEILIMQYFVGG